MSRRAMQVHLSYFFKTHLGFLKQGDAVLVACSGGPDSVALALALKSLSNPLPFRFHLAHVNHRLRGVESERDAMFVRELARTLHWPFHAVACPVRDTRGNLEENARVRRYTAFVKIAKKTRSRVVLTAHTRDDHAETILMNLLRGAGPDGLAGIPFVRSLDESEIILARPFLEIGKSEILKELRRQKAPFRSDRSNRQTSFLRNWMRLKLIPLIEQKSPGFKNRLTQTAALLRSDQEFWEEILIPAERRVMRQVNGLRLLDLTRLLRYSAAVQRRLLRRLAGERLLPFESVEGWRRWMMAPPSGGRLWQLRKGWTVERLSKSSGSPSARLFRIRPSQSGTQLSTANFYKSLKGMKK